MDFQNKRDDILEYLDFEVSDSEYSNPGYIEYTPPRYASSDSYGLQSEDYFSELYDTEVADCAKAKQVPTSHISSDETQLGSNEVHTELGCLKGNEKVLSFLSSGTYGFPNEGVSSELYNMNFTISEITNSSIASLFDGIEVVAENQKEKMDICADFGLPEGNWNVFRHPSHTYGSEVFEDPVLSDLNDRSSQNWNSDISPTSTKIQFDNIEVDMEENSKINIFTDSSRKGYPNSYTYGPEIFEDVASVLYDLDLHSNICVSTHFDSIEATTEHTVEMCVPTDFSSLEENQEVTNHYGPEIFKDKRDVNLAISVSNTEVGLNEHEKSLSTPDFNFSKEHGVSPILQTFLEGGSPLSVFMCLIDSNIINDMVLQTNLYASQCLRESHSRLRLWKPTTRIEMMKFVGIVGYMGLVKMPSIRCYWSTEKLWRNKLISKGLSWRRFKNLLSMWNFANVKGCAQDDDFSKIQPLVDSFVKNCKMAYTPGEHVYIDNRSVPELCSSNKFPKHGIKFLKLVTGEGYTWNLKLCTEQEIGPSEEIMQLSCGLLNCGRTVFTDSDFTSVDLASKLLLAKTHLIGRLVSNQGNVPEFLGMEENTNITITKIPGQPSLLMLSTKSSSEISDIKKLRKNIKQTNRDHRKSRDLDNCLRSLEHYKKFAIAIIWDIAIVNAHILYQKVCKQISITKFRQEVIKGLLEAHGNQGKNKGKTGDKKEHTFIKEKGVSRIGRKYCRGCYAKKLKGEITKNKVKKVVSFCLECMGRPRYCLPCFKDCHK